MHVVTADALARLETWYLAQCNGDWEHSYGVKIGTLDNPGWCFEIDLQETVLDGRAFAPVQIERSELDWLTCSIEDDRAFHAYCGPHNLHEALGVFLDWADGA
jgi:hypothetical protein